MTTDEQGMKNAIDKAWVIDFLEMILTHIQCAITSTKQSPRVSIVRCLTEINAVIAVTILQLREKITENEAIIRLTKRLLEQVRELTHDN